MPILPASIVNGDYLVNVETKKLCPRDSLRQFILKERRKMQTENLLKVTYHYDTDTGMIEIGEIDFAIYGELENYIKQYGYEGVKDILAMLGHLAWEVKQTFYKLNPSPAGQEIK